MYTLLTIGAIQAAIYRAEANEEGKANVGASTCFGWCSMAASCADDVWTRWLTAWAPHEQGCDTMHTSHPTATHLGDTDIDH